MLRCLLCLCLLLSFNVHAGELTGYAALEGRWFFDETQFDEQESNNAVGVVIEPEFYHVSINGNDIYTIRPFARYDSVDSHRSHLDMRQLDWVHASDNWETRVGVSKVFWGVTESNHLVDIINQTDLLEDAGGEDKLGQPMIELGLFQDFGTMRFFYLPYFREQKYVSQDGRLRGDPTVEIDQAIYDSDAKEWYPSFAFRYEHSFSDWDVGLSHFSGMGRDPSFVSKVNGDGADVFVPVYDVIQQTGLDVQLTSESWLWKLEAISRAGQGERFYASTFGAEYSFYALGESGYDLGLLLENSSDNRDLDAPSTIVDSDIFFGSRLVFNDVSDSEILAGIFFDYETQAKVVSVEAATRYGNNWRVELDARFFGDARENTLEYNFKQDSHLQLRLARYF